MNARIKSFLSYFGRPLVILLDEKGVNKDYYSNTSISKSKLMTEEECRYINSKEPFSVNFTPNGNYKDHTDGLASGSPLTGIRSKSNPGGSPYLNAICIDCDYKFYDGSPEQLLQEINKVCGDKRIAPSFVSQTTTPSGEEDKKFGGYHVYFVIKPDDREKVTNDFAHSFFDLMKYMNQMFPGYDGSDMVLSSTLRLPLSCHWKRCEPKGEPNPPGALLTSKLNDGLLSFKEWDGQLNVPMIGYEDISAAIQYMNAEKIDVKEEKDLKNKYSLSVFNDINKIPFPELFKKLSNYPRKYKGYTQVFSIQDTFVLINGDTNNGYKYWKETNVLNCFSSEFHSRDERPCGRPIHFLFKYFQGNKANMSEFLLKEFGYNLMESTFLEPGEDVGETFNASGDALMFTQNRIILQSNEKDKPSWVTLFKQALEYRGYGTTRLNSDKYSQANYDKKVYIFEYEGTKYLIQQIPTKKEFNRIYAQYGFFFYGVDNHLGSMYHILSESDGTKEFTFVERDGFYGEYFVHGGNIIGQPPKNVMFYMQDAEKFEIAGKTSPLSEFIQKLSTQFKPQIAIPSALLMIAMAGLNYRGEGGSELGPQIMLTGLTQSGKTTLYEMLKSMIGMPHKFREQTVRSTADALMKKATGGNILFVEEITGEILNKGVEDTLRNVINKSPIEKGRLADTVRYEMRSPVFGLGERVFDSESLNNRFSILVMDKKYITGTQEGILNLKGKNCCMEIYQTYLTKNQDECIKVLDKNTKRLNKEKKYPHRLAKLRSYALAINEIFNLKYDRDLLFTYIDENVKNAGSNMGTHSLQPEDILKRCALEAYSSRKISVEKTTNRCRDTIKFIFLSGHFERNKIVINTEIGKMTDAHPELLGRISMTPDGFQINYSWDKDADAFDQALRQTFGGLTSMLKGAVSDLTKQYN